MKSYKVKINDYPTYFMYYDLTDFINNSNEYKLSTKVTINSVKYNLYKIRNLKYEIIYTLESKIFPKKTNLV